MRRVNMVVHRLTPSPEELALDLFAAKLQRRVSGSSLDDLFIDWIVAATEHFQEQTGRQCVNAPFEVWLDSFPCDRYLELPRPPLQSVDAVDYLDGSGDWVAFDPENYTVMAPAGTHCAPGRIVLNDGCSWPTPVQREGAVKVSFTAGYGDTHLDVPRLVRASLMFLVGHFHKYGEEVIGGLEANSLAALPIGASTMIRGFRDSALLTQRPWEVSWLD